MGARMPERREPAEAARVRLELSGSRLSEALARLVAGCEPQGGVERYVEALKLKGALFRDALGARGEYAAALEPHGYLARGSSYAATAETSRAGVFVAGAACGPETIDDSIAQGHAAAATALAIVRPARASA